MSRYIVARTEGYTIGGIGAQGGGRIGVTFSVLDSAVCHRLCGEFRGNQGMSRIVAQAKAEALAAELERRSA